MTMHRLQCALLATVAVIGFASIASAADMPTKTPVYKAAPAIMAPGWAGWYIGVNAGWVGSGRNISNTGTDNNGGGLGAMLAAGAIPASVSLNNNGFIGGAQIGYNWQVANWVYGLEADFDGASAKSSTTAVFPGSSVFFPLSTTYNRQLDWLATFRGRIGITAAPAFLLYATGGLAVGNTKIGNAFICAACVPPASTEPSTVNQTSNTSAGWTVGAGLEWMFAPQWSLKAEYLYVDLGSHSSTITFTYGAPNTSTLTSTVRDTENVVRGGINYHF
jgi:outer membrane immunogenic protein